MNSGSSGTPGKANTTQTPQPPTTKKTATPRKRKARVLEDDNDVDEEGEEGDAQAPPQVDGSNEAQPVATPRQTRGKKLSYDFSAILDSDNDSSLVSFDDNDEDYILGSSGIKFEDEHVKVESKEDVMPKPASKRLKKATPWFTRTSATPTTSPGKYGKPVISKTIMAPKSEQRVTAKKKFPPMSVPLAPKVKAKAKAKASMHPSDKPIPSIERSPPPTPAGTYTDGEGDVDLRVLRPGRLVRFPIKHQAKPSFDMRCGVTSATRTASPAISILSISLSAASDSPARMLQQELDEHVIRPEDSVSMVDQCARAPATPNGTSIKSQTK